MPRIHERAFRVRHYECDAYGHVNNTNYVRYMQEAAFDASAAAGYDMARYAALGTYWLIRETDVEYLSPLRFGDTVSVKTWVADFRRVRSRRAYELRNAASGEMVARGATDWVYLDTQTGQPVRVPEAMVTAFFPEGAPPPSPRRAPLPPAPPPPPGVFTMRRQVMWQDVDPLGHLNNAQYLAFVSDCAFEAAAAFGWSAARMQAAGFGIIVRRLHIEYLEPALLGDEVAIATWWYGRRPASATRTFAITRPSDGARIAHATGQYAWVDLASGQPRRIPADILADLTPNCAD